MSSCRFSCWAKNGNGANFLRNALWYTMAALGQGVLNFFSNEFNFSEGLYSFLKSFDNFSTEFRKDFFF